MGRILDADFSSEMAKLTKSMILSKAANYVLSETRSQQIKYVALKKKN